MLSIPSIEARSNNRMLMRNHFLRGAVEMVLGRRIVTTRENVARVFMAVADQLRSLAVVVSAKTRRGNNEKPGKAVWFSGSLYATNIQHLKRCAPLVKMNKLFLFYSFLHVVKKLMDLRLFKQNNIIFKKP